MLYASETSVPARCTTTLLTEHGLFDIITHRDDIIRIIALVMRMREIGFRLRGKNKVMQSFRNA